MVIKTSLNPLNYLPTYLPVSSGGSDRSDSSYGFDQNKSFMNKLYSTKNFLTKKYFSYQKTFCHKKLKMRQISNTQNETKLKNATKLKVWQNSKTQNVTTQKLEFVTKPKNSKCDKTQKLKM